MEVFTFMSEASSSIGTESNFSLRYRYEHK